MNRIKIMVAKLVELMNFLCVVTLNLEPVLKILQNCVQPLLARTHTRIAELLIQLVSESLCRWWKHAGRLLGPCAKLCCSLGRKCLEKLSASHTCPSRHSLGSGTKLDSLLIPGTFNFEASSTYSAFRLYIFRQYVL